MNRDELTLWHNVYEARQFQVRVCLALALTGIAVTVSEWLERHALIGFLLVLLSIFGVAFIPQPIAGWFADRAVQSMRKSKG